MSLSEGDRAAWRAALNVGFGSLKLHKTLVQDKLLTFHDGRGESMLDVPLDVDVTYEEGWAALWDALSQQRRTALPPRACSRQQLCSHHHPCLLRDLFVC